MLLPNAVFEPLLDLGMLGFGGEGGSTSDRAWPNRLQTGNSSVAILPPTSA